jgi:citrate lyase beta subunit
VKPSFVSLSRSHLFVPASRPDMIKKAAQSIADVVCIDLEDSVAPDRKEISRQNVIDALNHLEFGLRGRMVRINALDTPYAYRDVVDIVEKAGNRIDLIMLPKVQKPEDIHFLDVLLTQIEANIGLMDQIGIEAQIETASGFVNLKEIGKSSKRLKALIFGSGDYAASMQMPLENIGEMGIYDDLYPGHRWHTVMHEIVAVARTNGLRCMDGPYANFQDDKGFEKACQIALAMGFEGKQCIHPAQLSIANRVFSPTEEQVKQAERIVAAYESALEKGVGVISIDGKMIDMVNIRLAQSVLDRARIIRAKEIE